MINQKEKEIELLKQHCAVGGRVEISDDDYSSKSEIFGLAYLFFLKERHLSLK